MTMYPNAMEGKYLPVELHGQGYAEDEHGDSDHIDEDMVFNEISYQSHERDL